MRIARVVALLSVSCASTQTAQVLAPKVEVIAAAPPPMAPAVLYGTGLAEPIAARCARNAPHCAVVDREGRLAIIERTTGTVLATQYFGQVDALKFDERGERLGVGAHRGAFEWSWRTGVVTPVGEASYRDAVVVSEHHMAWVSRSRGRDYDVTVIGRQTGATHTLHTSLVKVLHLLEEDLLLVVHTDALEVWQLRGDAPPTVVASFNLPPEPQPQVRAYGGRPVVSTSHSYLLVEASPTELLVLTKRLEPVRTVALNHEQVVVDPSADRFAHLEGQPSGQTLVIVEDVASGRVLARTEVRFSTGSRVDFSTNGLLFDSWVGRFAWDLQHAPLELRREPHVLAVSAGQRVEALGDTVQFSDFFGSAPSAEARSFGSAFVDGQLRLFADRVVLESKQRVRSTESWGAEGIGASAPAGEWPYTQEADTLTFAGGRTLRFKKGELESLRRVEVDPKRTRAVMMFAQEWRLYDVTTGQLLRRVKDPAGQSMVSYADDGHAFLIADDEWLTLHDRQGVVRGRFQHFKPDANGFGRSSNHRSVVLWTKDTVVLARDWQHLWFLHSTDLRLLAMTPLDVVELAHTKTGVLARLRHGLALFDESGTLRRRVEAEHNASGLQVLSEDGALVAWCDGSKFVVMNERGEPEDEEASLCERAQTIGVSAAQLAVARDGAVDFVRRGDRSRWHVRSFAGPRRDGYRSPEGTPPRPPERVLLVEHEAQFEVWPRAASHFVTTVGPPATSVTNLLNGWWQ